MVFDRYGLGPDPNLAVPPVVAVTFRPQHPSTPVRSSAAGADCFPPTLRIKFDDQGNPTRVLHKDGNGDTTSSTEWEYDDVGRETKETIKDGDGEVIESHEREYDAEGNMIKETHTDQDGNMRIHELEYDENGDVIRETIREGNGRIISLKTIDDFRMVLCAIG